jgi:hypothetical protein
VKYIYCKKPVAIDKAIINGGFEKAGDKIEGWDLRYG